MKKSIVFILLIPLLFFIASSCGNADTKTEITDNNTVNGNQTDSTGRGSVTTVHDDVNEKNSTASGNIVVKKMPNEILANIDQHLVSKVSFSEPPVGGGINNGIVTIRNTLPDVTFQKVIVEVSILTEANEEYRTDYYTFQNVEPGESKSAKMPKTTRGIKAVSHVVKLKSSELTNGEMILVGNKFAAQ